VGLSLDLCTYQDQHLHFVQKAVFYAQLMVTQQPALLLVYLAMFTYFLIILVPLLAQAHNSESIQLTLVEIVILRA
jgi:hypothetical protein